MNLKYYNLDKLLYIRFITYAWAPITTTFNVYLSLCCVMGVQVKTIYEQIEYR